METAYFGGGCFWGIEAAFSHVKGVESVVSGYSGDTKINPTYEEVSSGLTGHAETVKIEFNPEAINYDQLLKIFFLIHDPTTPNRQGMDVGTQYRSIILYKDAKQREAAEKVIKEIQDEKVYGDKEIVTEIMPFESFYPAEDYHQKYFEKNPGRAPGTCFGKLNKIKEKFPKYYI
jgi:peptide-methionine (S)-S-oxide reductase